MKRQICGLAKPALLALLAVQSGCSANDLPPGQTDGLSAITIGAGADNGPSGAFQARLGVYPLNANVAEPLTHVGSDFQLEPLLAKRWEYRGRNTWRFHLQQNVTFHDGQHLSGRAVAESMTHVARERMGNSGLGEHSVRVIDDSTVDITPTMTNLNLPFKLAHPNYSIFAPGTNPAIRPVGTGPFRWVEYRPHDRIVVERDERYRGTPPRLSRITFRFMPDANTRTLALLAGEVDLIMDLPREQITEVNRRGGFRIERAAPGQVLALQVNAHGKPPHDLLRDRALRRAIAHAIDQRQLVREMWRGEAKLSRTMTVPAILGMYADSVRGLAFDMAASQRLLDGAGWRRGRDGLRRSPGGRALQIELVAGVEVETAAIELIQAQLRRVGIDARITRLADAGAHSTRLAAGLFDLNLSTSNQNDANPLFLPALVFYSKSERPFARWYAAGPRFDSIVEQGLATADPEETRRLAAAAMRVAVEEEAVCIPVAALFRIYALRENLVGFEPHPSQTNQSWGALYRKSK
ncbi:MAG: ABC transporter substrate-binding protein [Gemmatimonadaceae bacterium]